MSEEIKNALRPDIDAKVADYADAAASVVNRDCIDRTAVSQNDVMALDRRIDEVEQQINDLKAQIAVVPDDKYSLTKAKLIRLMKALGYYE